MIETYLMVITLLVGVIAVFMTAGPGTKLHFFPHRLFLYSLTVSLICASLFHFIRLADPTDLQAKIYSQWVNAIARTGMAVTGVAILWRHRARCQRKRNYASGK